MKNALPPHPTTDLHDANPNALRCTLQFVDYGATRLFAGRIRTVVTMEDSKLAQSLFSQPGEGGIAVIDGGGSMRTAMLGDRYAAICAENGWSGVIVNGAIRDAERLADIPLGIKALAATPTRSAKTGIGAIDVPVAFGGVLFMPGDCVYCDLDGVVVGREVLGVA